MSAHHDTVPTRRRPANPKAEQRTADCPCECGGACEASCCSLDCLEQPRFFCGQALNDSDLNALVGWTRDKARLARFRDGWGVACGLEVRCDPDRAGGIIVGPGYGPSCCGDDIVVCEDTRLDLGDLCSREDPCADPMPVGTDRRRRRPHAGKDPAPSDESGERVFDIYVRYKEVLGHPQAALGRRDRSPSGSDCDYARTRESAELVAIPAASGTDPASHRAGRWSDGYEACLSVVDEFRAAFGDDGQEHEDGEAVRTWLIRWMETHHPHQFCFLEDEVCNADRDELTGENLIRILYLLAQDCRNAYLSAECHSCTTPSGVPLARVWLDVRSERGRDVCAVTCIDGYPPYRRNLGQERWPAPIGKVNLGSVIWRRQEEALGLTRGLGIRANSQVTYELPASVAGLLRDLKRIGNLIVDQDEAVRPVIYRDAGDSGGHGWPCGEGGRIIGLERGYGPDDMKKVPDEERPRRIGNLEPLPAEPEEPVPAPPKPPEPAEPPRPTSPPRDIEEINGIGPRRAEILRSRGIRTTHDLRSLSVADLGEMIPETTVSTLRRLIAEAQ
ncbi:MAG: helix-hairpin-helix domain-containing protein [Chloroflexi bacterium]|nr:helix-hairpin-helix domain-containing protein [Chloroflexota bacterium]